MSDSLFWQPRAGDLARIRLSLECQSHWDRHPHEVLESIQGRTVRVLWTDDERAAGHPIWVQFDPPCDGPLAGMGALLAAIELEPASEASSASRRTEGERLPHA